MSTALTIMHPRQLELIRKTVAKDCDRDSMGNNLHLGEFDWFMSICKSLGLDPLRRQIYAFVFSKDDPAKRQMVPVIGIGGYRTIAERTGNYRPGDSEITYDERLRNPDTNPLGIVCAKVVVFKRSHGDWFPFSETAYWDEFAPITMGSPDGYDWIDTGEVWKDTGKPKKKKVPKGKTSLILDPAKDAWRKMARVMIEKCAEAKALRRGWPDSFSGTYAEGELDRAEVLDLTATEMADKASADAKLALIGGADALIVDWCDGSPLARVPAGAFCDKVLAWSTSPDLTSTELRAWWQRNGMSRAEFKAKHGGEYLEFQKAFEDLVHKRGAAEQSEQAAE